MLTSDTQIPSENGLRSESRKRAREDSGGIRPTNLSQEEYENLTMENKLSVLFSQMKNVCDKVDDCILLQKRVNITENTLSNHDHRLKLLKYKSFDLEARSRRNNLIFSGISELRDENCTTRIDSFLKEHLGFTDCPPITRAHRLGKYKKGSTRSIIVCFLDFRDTNYVMSKAHMLKGKEYSINKDFPKEIVDARRRLWPEYKHLRQIDPGAKTSIVYPAKLISNGHTIADEFADWGPIMPESRTVHDQSTGPLNQSTVQLKHHESRVHHNKNSDSSNSELINHCNTSQEPVASSSHRSRRYQSPSPHPSRARNRAPVGRRADFNRQTPTSNSKQNFQRPWQSQQTSTKETSVNNTRSEPPTRASANNDSVFRNSGSSS